jgi:multidrug transporter EmrE-like cation transporter
MVKALVLCFLYAVLNVSGAAIIKWKLKGKQLDHWNDWFSFLFQVPVLTAFTIIFASALVLFKALSSGQFSFIVPVAVGINFILTVVLGYLLFKDPVNLISLLGFTLILSGIILLSTNTVQYVK